MGAFRPLRRINGFTLVEAIIVMVITGILAGMVAIFIKTPVQSYIDTAARAEMSDAADLALRRMSRELRLALPNSVLVSADGSTIQFLLTKTGGRYISASDEPPNAVKALSFTDSTAVTFNMAGAAPSGRQAITAGDFVIVYNLGLGQTPADAYDGKNVAKVKSVVGTLIEMETNPFAAATPQMPSPDNRFQIVTGSVAYQCVSQPGGKGTMKRYFSNSVPSMTARPVNQPVAPIGAEAMMITMVDNCMFTSEQLANTQAAIVTMNLTLRHANNEAVKLVRQVHVDNTP